MWWILIRITWKGFLKPIPTAVTLFCFTCTADSDGQKFSVWNSDRWFWQVVRSAWEQKRDHWERTYALYFPIRIQKQQNGRRIDQFVLNSTVRRPQKQLAFKPGTDLLKDQFRNGYPKHRKLWKNILKATSKRRFSPMEADTLFGVFQIKVCPLITVI